jgi:hypothetical protein
MEGLKTLYGGSLGVGVYICGIEMRTPQSPDPLSLYLTSDTATYLMA